MKWTKEQALAIEAKGNNILVAAAAGSGKTAVLVERIINKVLNQKINIDELLVVTFTNAAAAEMRERLVTRLYEKLEEGYDETIIRKQLLLLNKASITTIHSFCLEVIRNNYFETDINPNFKIGDDVETYLLKLEALEEVFEKRYEEKDENFEILLNTYSNYKNDEGLRNLVLFVYNFIQSSPFPFEWLLSKIDELNLNHNLDFSKTVWGEILVNKIKNEINDMLENLISLKLELEADKNYKYVETVVSDILNLETVQKTLNLSWNELIESINNIQFDRLKSTKVGSEFLKEYTKEIRDDIKSRIKKLKDNVCVISSEKSCDDLRYMYDILIKLQNLIKDFDDIFTKKKKDKNIIDFNDIEHYALKILVKKDNTTNEYMPTEVAKKYKNKFKEILIDEYQDSNYIQEYILTQISNGKNMFMVGDVKQSIYRFRQARPDLFLNKYNNYSEDFCGNEYGQKIKLFKNFRSRKNVLEFTNNIFEQIMSENVGELNYTKEEFLNYGASYLEEDLPIEIKILTDEKEELEEAEEPIDNIEAESILVANKIEELLKSDTNIYDKKIGKYRRIQEKDIAILLRTTKNYSNVFLSELSKRNINAYSDSEESYLNSVEVNTIISILKVIDNPMQDIPLIATLRSGLLGKFTDSELIEIRLIDKRCNFFEALMKKQINKDGYLCEKINAFLEKISKLQEKVSYLKISELIWQILSETGFLSYASLMPDGEKRTKNLKLLFEKATQYEKTNLKGLFNFIKFIDKLILSSKDTSSAKLISENDNVVRIMSIHKSKGLEFPVVVFSGVGKKFNLQDLKEKLLIHSEIGLGPEYINCEEGISYSTLAKEAIKEKMKLELLSEEMRLLYVALTRAKEKLIITGIKKNTKNLKTNNKISEYKISMCTNFLSWLEFTQKEKIFYYNMIDLNKKENRKDNTKKIPEFSQCDIKFEKIFNKKYNQELCKIPTKASASLIDDIYSENNNMLLYDAPEFLKDISKYKNGAEKGSEMHKVLELLPLKKYFNLEELQKEVLKITKDDINIGKIYNFTKSALYEKIITSKKIEKEKAFCMLMPINEIYENVNSEENIIVQGIIDCYFETLENGNIILVDYKTDFIGGDFNEFISKHKKQLITYKKAIEKSTNKVVEEVYLYSFFLDKAIKIL